MPFIKGPELDSLVTELTDWYYRQLDFLMDALEEDYPYHATKLTPTEQYANYRAMGPEEWRQFVIDLEARYRGYPDARQRVQNDIDSYVARMEALGSKVGAVEPPEA